MSPLLKSTWEPRGRQLVVDILQTLPAAVRSRAVHLLVLHRRRGQASWAASRNATLQTPWDGEVPCDAEHACQASSALDLAHRVPPLERLLAELVARPRWADTLALPLQRVGLLLVEPGERPLPARTLSDLRRHLRLAGTALANVQDSLQEARELEGYRALSNLLDSGATRNRRSLIQALGKSMATVTHAKQCLILARANDADPLVPIGSRGYPAERTAPLAVWPHEEPWASLLASEQPMFEVATETLAPAWQQAFDDGSLTVAPIRWKGWVRSLLILPSDAHHAGGSHLLDPARLASVGAQAGLLWQNAELIGRLRRDEEVLQGLIQRAIEVQEEERRRIASDIHDGVTQRIIGLWYKILHLERLLAGATPEAREVLSTVKQQVDAALQEARAAIFNLRPLTLDDLGLIPSLHSLVSDFRQETGARCDIEVRHERRLPPHVEVGIYRIAQEALRNVKKHAQASAASLSLVFAPDTVRLTVRDNGVGFSRKKRRGGAGRVTSFGLESMEERAHMLGADLFVQSSPGEGTTVRVAVRLPRDEPAA